MQGMHPLMGATEMAVMDEPVFLTYVDLDRLIEQCGLSNLQRSVVNALMEGYYITDCADMLSIQKQAAIIHLNRAVEKITAQNDKSWDEVYQKS